MEYESIYSKNGNEDVTGPFPLPTGDGSMVYGALGASNATYPIHLRGRASTP